MRIYLIILFLVAGPAAAWDFMATPICTLRHSEARAEVKVTFDPGAALYAISITRPGGWPDAPQFSIRFDGARPNLIATGRHSIAGSTLTVTDTGFGNVLDGLASNSLATARAGNATVRVSLRGAEAPVHAFRACVRDRPAV